MGKAKKAVTPASVMRAQHRAERVEALRDGRRQVAHRMPNAKAAASKRACRGKGWQ